MVATLIQQGMTITFSIFSILALVFCIVIIVDRTIFMRKMKEIHSGMTGAEIKEKTNLRLIVKKIEGRNYEAIVYSKTTIFRFTLIFNNGHLITKIRN